jgi:predicted metal-dependent phosphoesterase TrpH
MRAITHIHTIHSWDGSLKPLTLVDWLASSQIDLALVTDHDTFDGAFECRRIARQRGLSLRVPTAAEIRTERGDVVVVFDEDVDRPPPIAALKQWTSLVPAVCDLGGLLWLPHPYQSHEYTEELAAGVDVIEVFNARCSAEQNRNATHLCERHGAVPAYGADAHRRADLGRCVVDYDDRGPATETLRVAPTPVLTSPNDRSSTMAAQFVDAWRDRRPVAMAFHGLRWAQTTVEERRSVTSHG